MNINEKNFGNCSEDYFVENGKLGMEKRKTLAGMVSEEFCSSD